jgi:hypothetical protein
MKEEKNIIQKPKKYRMFAGLTIFDDYREYQRWIKDGCK